METNESDVYAMREAAKVSQSQFAKFIGASMRPLLNWARDRTDLAGPASGQIQCFTSAPRLERVLLRSGGTALVCTTQALVSDDTRGHIGFLRQPCGRCAAQHLSAGLLLQQPIGHTGEDRAATRECAAARHHSSLRITGDRISGSQSAGIAAARGDTDPADLGAACATDTGGAQRAVAGDRAQKQAGDRGKRGRMAAR